MSTSETDSDSEPLPTDTVSTLTAFANASTARPGQPSPTSLQTITWAMDTLAALDFRLVRKDTTLHGLVQDCAGTILALLDIVLRQGPATGSLCDSLPDIASMLRPSFLHLLFQYRRLFRVIATRDFRPSSTPLAVVCWVDVVLAKLSDVTAFVVAGVDGDHPDKPLPESLRAQREEDNLRAAIQLPDNWDMLPAMLLSERVSVAAKRLTIRLMLGTYILCPTLSGQVCLDNTIHQLFSMLAEFVRQSAARVDDLRTALGPGSQYLLQQERLTSAMTLTLFAAASTIKDPIVSLELTPAFRPHTVAAAMQLLRFVLNEREYATQANILNPPNHLDNPTSLIMRWGFVPQWTWSVWPECSTLHADTAMYLTTTYIQHHSTGPGGLLEVLESMHINGRSSDQAAMVSVMIDLVFRFISVLSAGADSRQLSAGMMNILRGCCQLISRCMNRNTCGIQRSKECCKALIILFGYSCQSGQHFIVVNELVIECLVLMKEECAREAWKTAAEDNNFHFLEALGQGFRQTKITLLQDNLPKSRETSAAQLMQFLVIMMVKGVRPLDLRGYAEFLEAVGERVLEAPRNEWQFLCENLLVCLASANLSATDLPFSKGSVVVDDEVLWRLGVRGGSVDLFLASAFSAYITSVAVSVERLTYLEGLEHLLDIALLICSRQYAPEDEAIALVVLPTICDGLAYLMEYNRSTCEYPLAGVCSCANARTVALFSIAETLCGGQRGRLWSTKRELVFCRTRLTSDGRPRLVYIREV